MLLFQSGTYTAPAWLTFLVYLAPAVAALLIVAAVIRRRRRKGGRTTPPET